MNATLVEVNFSGWEGERPKGGGERPKGGVERPKGGGERPRV